MSSLLQCQYCGKTMTARWSWILMAVAAGLIGLLILTEAEAPSSRPPEGKALTRLAASFIIE